MKKIILIAMIINCSIYTFGQKNEEINLIQVDSTWGKEIIQIPFWFAPEINYKGKEDIRFAKGWGKIDSIGFWTLVFAWDINLKSKPTVKFFENNLKLYFDGLMKVVIEDSLLTIPKTKAFFKEEKQINGITTYIGTIEVYDAFTTKKMIVLNVEIASHYCGKTKKYMPLFKCSPRNLNHESWNMLNQAKLNANICNSL